MIGKDLAFTEKIGGILTKNADVKLVGKTYIHSDFWKSYKEKVLAFVDEYHKANPLKVGISKEELRSRLPATDVQIFQAVLDECASDGRIVLEKDRVTSGAHARANQNNEIEKKIVEALRSSAFTPPGLKDLPPVSVSMKRMSGNSSTGSHSAAAWSR